MEKRVELSLLCDFYGPLLTESRLKMLKLYCEEDLTLQEIAEDMGITRQGVSDAIRHAETQLRDYENKLGFLEKYDGILSAVEQALEELEKPEGTQKAKEILRSIQNDER